MLWLWTTAAAIDNGLTTVSWPCDEFLKSRVDVFDEPEDRFKGLFWKIEKWMDKFPSCANCVIVHCNYLRNASLTHLKKEPDLCPKIGRAKTMTHCRLGMLILNFLADSKQNLPFHKNQQWAKLEKLTTPAREYRRLGF